MMNYKEDGVVGKEIWIFQSIDDELKQISYEQGLRSYNEVIEFLILKYKRNEIEELIENGN